MKLTPKNNQEVSNDLLILEISIRFMDPLANGEYPRSMRSLVGERLPRFTEEQSRMLNGSFDFLGLNYYTAFYAAYAPGLKRAKPSYNTDPKVSQTGKYRKIYTPKMKGK